MSKKRQTNLTKNLPMYLLVGAGVLAGLYFIGARMRPAVAWDEVVPMVPKPATEPIVIPKTYTVVSGDSLSAIADRFGITLAEVIFLNPQFRPGGRSPSEIYPGESIRVSK